MAYPQTPDELEAAGYRFDTVGRCRGRRCTQEMHWWFTPTGKRIPLDADGTPHWTTCVDQQQFDKAKKSPRDASDA